MGGARPVPGEGRPRAPEILLPRDVPLSLRPHPHGPRPRLRHRRPPRPVQVDARLQRPPPDGVGRLRPSRRERGHRARRPSRHLDPREHRLHALAAPAAGPLLRLGSRGDHLRSGVLPVGAAHLHQDAGAGPRLPQALHGELVPVLPDRAGQRAGRGRPLLALRLRGHPPGDRRLVLQDHRLRRGTAGVVRSPARLARAGHDHAAQLDRPQRGRGVRPSRGRAPRARPARLHHAARHRLRHDLRRPRPRASPGRSARSRARRSAPPWPPSARRSRGSRRSSGRRPTGRSGASACRRAWSTRSTAPRSRSSSPTTCSWGTARAPSWPCPARTSATGSSPSSTACPSSRRCSGPPAGAARRTRATGSRSTPAFLDGLTVAEAKRRAIDWLVERGLGVAKVNYRLRDWGISRQRYWGAPIPVLYCDACGMVPEKEENLPVVLPEDVQISGKGGSPLAEVATFVNARCPRCGGRGPARDRHHGHLRRVVVVLPALLLAPLRGGHGGARSRRLLDAGGPVHRRHRARRPAPPLRPLLHQGAARSRSGEGRRAVHGAAQPGHGHQGRRQDVEVQGQRRRSRRSHPDPRRRHRPPLLAVRGAAREGSRLERPRGGGGLAVSQPRVAVRDRPDG